MNTRNVSWWGIVPSAASPVLLAAGWTIAASLQSRPYDPVANTVSALAGIGASDRWLMTLIFVVAGVCDIVTGLALRPARAAGRLTLMAGGIAGILVAASPVHMGRRCPGIAHRVGGGRGRRTGGVACWPPPIAARLCHGPCARWYGPGWR